jgi:hypothetical protein
MLKFKTNKRARIFLGVLFFLQSYAVIAWELSGYVGIESLGFFQNPVDNQQHSHYLSGVLQPQLVHEWDDGQQSFAFVPFYRYSQYDDRRTHFDIRELTWLKVAEKWELRVGFRKVFWGVTESEHLVDIVNQTDLVENLDMEDKLGQPMVNLALIRDWERLIYLYYQASGKERSPDRKVAFVLIRLSMWVILNLKNRVLKDKWPMPYAGLKLSVIGIGGCRNFMEPIVILR